MKKTFLLIALLLCISNPVYANSGPWRNEPPPGFNAVPLKSNTVEVLKEDLTFDLTSSKTPSQADVTAKYTLRNLSDKAEKYSIAFPYVGGHSNNWVEQDKYFTSKVYFNDKQIVPQIKLIPDILFNASNGASGRGLYSRKGLANLTFEDIMKNMKLAVDAKEFDITKYIDKDPVFGELINTTYRCDLVVLILFDIEMPAYSTNQLTVSYNQIGGADRYKTKDYTFIYDYFLEPAKYWKDFKDLNITVKLPGGYRITESNLNKPVQKEYITLTLILFQTKI